MGDGRISRRRFVTGAAAAAGSAAAGSVGFAGSAAAAKKKRKRRGRVRRREDVVVVGAGLSGLVAARAVARAGHSVAVVEARDRVGGRMLSQRIGDDVVDLGAEFIGPTQNHIRALVDELAIRTFANYNAGKNVYYAGARRTLYSDTGPLGTAPPDAALLADLLLVVPQLNSMALQVGVDAPWQAPRAAQWDAISLETWIRRNSTRGQRFVELSRAATRAIFGAEPSEVSLLFVLFFLAASGDERNPGTFERNFNTRGGAQQDRIAGGTQSIAIALARALGRRVILRSPVRRIVSAGGYVDVISDRYVNRAKRVIVALPPALAGRIQYEPGLPASRDGLTQRFPQGHLLKVQAVYERPFWRGDGLNGTSIADVGPLNVTFDSSPESGSPGVLLGFAGGDEGRRYSGLGAGERRRAALGSFARAFGPLALEPIEFIEGDWPADPYSAGCPVGFAPPGVLTKYGPALREPADRIHWAGTESATFWNGYMDGAVRAGERAAREVLEAL